MDLYWIENVEFMDGGHGHQRVADGEHIRQWAIERGLALVPVEPTAAMIQAMREYWFGTTSALIMTPQDCIELCKTMIATAQEGRDG